MSFLVNDTDLKIITFQNEKVKSVYYNDTLVWTIPWPGAEAADWEDIYRLCKAKQSGAISEWPEDLTLGMTKEITTYDLYGVNNDIEDFRTTNVILVGIDIDGPGVLTFMTTEISHTNATEGYENLGYCADKFGKHTSPYYFIKPIYKEMEWDYYNDGTGYADRVSKREYKYIWAPSIAELDNDYEYGVGAPLRTVGVYQAYPYFAEDSMNRRALGFSYLLRDTYGSWNGSTSYGYEYNDVVASDGDIVSGMSFQPFSPPQKFNVFMFAIG